MNLKMKTSWRKKYKSMSEDFGAPQSRNEAILQNMLGANNSLLPPESRIEVLLQLLLEEWQNIDGGGSGSSITESSLLTLSVANWDATTKQQTVAIDLDTTNRNVIDITIGENEAWDNFGVYPVAETSTGITFEATEIPDQALTFKVCSMEVS